MKKQENTKTKLYPLAVLVTLALLLELVIKLFKIPSWLLPPPSEILKVLWQRRGVLFYHTQRTVFEAALGLSLAALLGVLVGIATAQSKLIRRIVYPLLVISQTIPLLVLAPLLAVWLGFGLAPKLVVVILSCFFPVALGTVVGLDGADPEMIKLVTAMGATERQIFQLVKLPQALPSIFGGLQVAASYSVTAAVVAEWMGSERGLGIYLLSSAHAFRTASVFAGIVIITLASLLFFALVETASKMVLPKEE